MTRFCIRSKRRNILPSRKRFSLVFAGRKKVPRGVINWISSWVWLNLWAKEMSLDWFPRCDADIIGREGMLHRPVVRVYRSVISAFACCPYGFLMNERHTQWQHYQGQSQSITSERGVCLKVRQNSRSCRMQGNISAGSCCSAVQNWLEYLDWSRIERW